MLAPIFVHLCAPTSPFFPGLILISFPTADAGCLESRRKLFCFVTNVHMHEIVKPTWLSLKNASETAA
jgi:hypothetical protein